MSKFSGIVDQHRKLEENAAAEGDPSVSKFSGIVDKRRMLGENAAAEGDPSVSKFSGIVDKGSKLEENAAAELEFNGERIETHAGETLVQAARRHGSYVWFLCDGRGLCQTCECRVLSGEENLSEVSQIERAGLGEKRRRKGYRLGCQARLVGSGSVSVVSRAEELRRRAREVWSGSEGRSLWRRLQDLTGDSLSATVDLLAGVTIVSPQAIPQLVKIPPTPARMAGYVRDTMRLASKFWSSESGSNRKNSHSNS